MICIDIETINLVVGALLGAFMGFGLTLLRDLWLKRKSTKKAKNYFAPYCGNYHVTEKSGKEGNLEEVIITHKNLNILSIALIIRNGNNAKGTLVMDTTESIVGRAYYNHVGVESEHISGLYDVVFIREGIIHATLTYAKENGQLVHRKYVWRKKEEE